MTVDPRRPVLVSVISDEAETLETLRGGDAADLQVGPVKPLAGVREAHLNPWEAAQLAYQVVTVIGTIGGVFQFIDWAIEKARTTGGPKRRLTIQIGSTKIEASGFEDLEALRTQLTQVLGG